MAHLLARTVTRREFTAASISALFVGMAVTLIDCSGGSSSYGTAPSPVTASGDPVPAPSGSKAGAISDNHGHIATVTSAQLTAGGGVALSIQGSANHDHSLALSASQVAQVAAGVRVSESSSRTTASLDTGYGSSLVTHDHTVVFN
jgi:hypothetical protein